MSNFTCKMSHFVFNVMFTSFWDAIFVNNILLHIFALWTLYNYHNDSFMVLNFKVQKYLRTKTKHCKGYTVLRDARTKSRWEQKRREQNREGFSIGVYGNKFGSWKHENNFAMRTKTHENKIELWLYLRTLMFSALIIYASFAHETKVCISYYDNIIN